MNDGKSPSDYERNLARLLRASQAPSEHAANDSLVHAVLKEVRKQRVAQRAAWWRTRKARWTTALAVAASLVLAWVSWRLVPASPRSAGEVRTAYGMVEIQPSDGLTEAQQAAQKFVEDWTPIPTGAWVQTLWGSQAEIRLADQSSVLSRPRTKLAVGSDRSGERVILNEGWISVEAAKQQPGKSLQIQTPGTRISVLGTKFDVYVVQKADGKRQTRVSVASGRVAMESGGSKIFLPPNTEGIAEEGQVPVRRCQTPEVNELLRLKGLNERLAREQQLAPGAPSLTEFYGDGTATVWLMTTVKMARRQGDRVELPLKTPVKEVAAYSMDGETIACTLDEPGLHVRIAAELLSQDEDHALILRLGGVGGIFSSTGKGSFELVRADQDPSTLSLYQVWLPESANIGEIRPKPIETSRSLSRRTVTMAVQAPPPDLIH